MRISGQDNIANLFGVTGTTIVEWQKDGFPVAVQGGRGVPNEYLAAECIAWLVAREVGKVHVETPRDRVFRLQGDALERDAVEKACKLVRADQVEPVWAAGVSLARQHLLAQPSVIADEIHGKPRRDVETLLRVRFEGLLRQMAGLRPKR